ncbi:hypothetical protein ACN4EG_26130 [Alkalinema pantanalense CENA528]
MRSPLQGPQIAGNATAIADLRSIGVDLLHWEEYRSLWGRE